MTYETVIWEESGRVGTLTLNRPATLNAWIPQLGQDLGNVISGEAAQGVMAFVEKRGRRFQGR